MELIAFHGSREAEIHLEEHDDGTFSVRVDDTTYEVDVADAGRLMSLRFDGGRQLEISARRLRNRGHAVYEITGVGGTHEVELTDPLTRLAEEAAGDAAGASTVTAYMPGRVVEVLVEEGESVSRGQGIVVLEAMKMKNEIQAESDGVVATLHVREGENVEGGDPLFSIESAE